MHNGEIGLKHSYLQFPFSLMIPQFSPLRLRNSHYLEMTDIETKLYNVFLRAAGQLHKGRLTFCTETDSIVRQKRLSESAVAMATG